LGLASGVRQIIYRYDDPMIAVLSIIGAELRLAGVCQP
jgi:hypothetical protein